jgi:cupin fold WbuC family metalloprotein
MGGYSSYTLTEPELIDTSLLDATTAAARESPRRRKNHNFHTPASEAANRLLNAVEPGSYIPPHRHLDPAKDETFVVLRGRFGLVCFDESGGITRLAVLDPGGEVVGANIPHRTYHTLVSLAPGSVFLETKAGPYAPIGEQERAPWAPREGDLQAADYLARLERLFR